MANARMLADRRRRVVARSKPLATQVSKWLRAYALLVLNQEFRGVISKRKTDEELRRELEELLTTFGLRQALRSAQSISGFEGALPVVVQREIAAKKALVTGIAAETRGAIQQGVGKIIADARREVPRPSAGEVARRIRAAFGGGRGKQMSFAVSPGRAALIARTELVQTENLGIVAGYEQLGIKRMEWLAYATGSGDRHHERMRGKIAKVGETFTTPLGNKLRFPGDPRAPIRDTANCRCTLAPVR